MTALLRLRWWWRAWRYSRQARRWAAEEVAGHVAHSEPYTHTITVAGPPHPWLFSRPLTEGEVQEIERQWEAQWKGAPE